MQGQLLHAVKIGAGNRRVNPEKPFCRAQLRKPPQATAISGGECTGRHGSWLQVRYFEEHVMPEIQIVKVDEGGVNARILAKEAKRSGVCSPAFENPTVVVGGTEKQAD